MFMFASWRFYDRFYIFFSCAYKFISMCVSGCHRITPPYFYMVVINYLHFIFFKGGIFASSKNFTIFFFPYHIICTFFIIHFNRFL